MTNRPPPHQGYYETSGSNEEMDEMLNSLVGSQAMSSHHNLGQYNNNASYYDNNKYYTTENNHESYPDVGSNKYYYSQDLYPPNPYPPTQNQNSRPLPPTPQHGYTYIDSSPAFPTPQAPMSMPMPDRYPPVDRNIYPPPEYHQKSIPSSRPTESYPPVGYPDHSQEYINNSYRPTFSQYNSDSLPSTPSTDKLRQEKHKRTPSSLRNNMIMTIERPRFDHLSETDLNNGDEVPFIPVSPDSSSDEEYFEKKPVEKKPLEKPHAGELPTEEAQVPDSIVPEPLPEPPVPEPVIPQPILEDSALDYFVEPQTIEAEPEVEQVKPSYALFSVLSGAFIRRVKGLENVREIYCAGEYNESFYGSEAVDIIRGLLDKQVPREYCFKMANSLMTSEPALFSPTHYSQRSIINHIMYDSEDTYFLEEDALDGEVPTGVFTPLTSCYSYQCTPEAGGCYSPKCPNNKDNQDLGMDCDDEISVSRTAMTEAAASPEGGWLVSHDAWASRVIVQGLERSESIEAHRLKDFIKMVFNNFEVLLENSGAMFRDFLSRARQYEGQCVPTIGDIILHHMVFFEEPFVEYSPHAGLAKYIAETEMKNNPEFEKFVKEVAKHERTNRLPIWHYLLSPVTRMQRYPLLIEALLKKTPEDHADHTYLTRCYDMIRSIASKADRSAIHTKLQLAILHIRDAITFRQGELYDLQLGDKNRRLYHQGILKRRSGSVEADKTDIYAFVFDHMVLLTKQRKTATGDEYRVWRKPIPLHMLVVQNTLKTLPGSSSFQTFDSAPRHSVSNGATLVLHHLGSRGGSVYPFYCSSTEEKQTWVKAMDDAKTSLKKRHGDMDVFELRPLDDLNFRLATSGGPPSGTTTRIHCSVPFVTAQNEHKIAIGTDNGVFFKTEGKDNSVRRAIQCESVLQLGIMEKHHILIVLTEKALRAYPVDLLDSKSNTKAIDRIEMEIGQHVNFFQLGFCNGRDMLVYKKKKKTSSVFTALEPFCDLRDSKNEKLLTPRTSLFSNKPEYLRWFKKYKDFYIGAEACNIHFLRAKLNIVCERGFEVIDPENLTVGRDIPDSEDPQFNFVTRHPEPLKPLAMYRINHKFLLCYDKFAFYVNNRNGSLVQREPGKPPVLCEWEGTPSHIVYEHPYIIAIDPYFIEVRHVETGELVQIISGENIRLAYYNGGEKPVIHVCMTHSQKPDTQALFHLSLNHRSSAPLRKGM
ncbi:CNH domain-containing protein [Sporodiniella umbellata]|nr:CNH domain-containing protein [Sporodiniella umbellata]